MAKKGNKRTMRPDWDAHCENCGSTPTVPISGLCGPCHFGTADAVGGGWWDEDKNEMDDEFVREHC